MIRTMILLLTVVFLTCCSESPNSNTDSSQESKKIMPDVFKKGLDLHGGLENWNKLNTLQYSIIKNSKKEDHTIDLKSRKVRIDHPDWTVGFDGKEVWVSPNKEAFGKKSARFYHNLYFYFYAMPFVLADPGINYEILEQDSLGGRLYNPVKITFDRGIGDAPKDEYIAYFDSESNYMGALLYTVTYYSGQQGNRYNAIVYDDWIDIDGMKLPASFKGYKYEDSMLGDLRYTMKFEGITLNSELKDPKIFEMPTNAQVDSLIQH